MWWFRLISINISTHKSSINSSRIGRIERLENIVQEAMASGGAVIANDHGCTDLQVQHGRTG